MQTKVVKVEKQKKNETHKTKSKMRDINPTISITLNISGVNNIAQSRLLDWKKKRYNYMLFTRNTV